MREELREPRIEPQRLDSALRLASEIYNRHEAGVSYAELLESLSELTGQQLNTSDAAGAFGSMSADTWARALLLSRYAHPSDLSDVELLELLRAICASDGKEWQISWWLRCVEASTGCAEVADLVFYPAETLGPNDGRNELTPEEILAEAKRRPCRVLVTLPPKGGAA